MVTTRSKAKGGVDHDTARAAREGKRDGWIKAVSAPRYPGLASKERTEVSKTTFKALASSNSTAGCALLQLPTDIFQQIVELLSPPDLLSCSYTCTRINLYLTSRVCEKMWINAMERFLLLGQNQTDTRHLHRDTMWDRDISYCRLAQRLSFNDVATSCFDLPAFAIARFLGNYKCYVCDSIGAYTQLAFRSEGLDGICYTCRRKDKRTLESLRSELGRNDMPAEFWKVLPCAMSYRIGWGGNIHNAALATPEPAFVSACINDFDQTEMMARGDEGLMLAWYAEKARQNRLQLQVQGVLYYFKTLLFPTHQNTNFLSKEREVEMLLDRWNAEEPLQLELPDVPDLPKVLHDILPSQSALEDDVWPEIKRLLKEEGVPNAKFRKRAETYLTEEKPLIEILEPLRNRIVEYLQSELTPALKQTWCTPYEFFRLAAVQHALDADADTPVEEQALELSQITSDHYQWDKICRQVKSKQANLQKRVLQLLFGKKKGAASDGQALLSVKYWIRCQACPGYEFQSLPAYLEHACVSEENLPSAVSNYVKARYETDLPSLPKLRDVSQGKSDKKHSEYVQALLQRLSTWTQQHSLPQPESSWAAMEKSGIRFTCQHPACVAKNACKEADFAVAISHRVPRSYYHGEVSYFQFTRRSQE